MLKSKLFLSALSFMLATLMLLLSLPVAATTVTETASTATSEVSKIDPALLEVMSEASPDEKIPVSIWYSDIDQREVDTLTATKVGFDKDNVAVDYEMPSAELLTSLETGEAGAESEMQSYLKRTESKRLEERERTDNYIMSRREISRGKYNEKSAKVLKEVSIPEEDILFKSQYAPMIIAELTKKQIVECSKSQAVEFVYDRTFESDSLPDGVTSFFDHIDEIQNTINYSETLEKIRINGNALNGQGVVIGVAEPGGYVLGDDELNASSISSVNGVTLYEDLPYHVTNVVRIIVGNNSGFAKGASVITSGTGESQIEALLDPELNVSVINMSFSSSYSTYYDSRCKWFDHLVSQHGVIIVASANNNDPDRKLCAPGIAYNTIMVGAYNLGDNSSIFSTDPDDDRMTLYTGYINTNLAEKPDVIMPGYATSYATPILTSCIALMLQLKPSLSAYPQAVKAIVLASCHRKVLPSSNPGDTAESIYDGVTDKQGAGAPDILTMMCIVCQGTYGVGRISAARNQAVRRFVMPSNSATSMNISLTWIRENYVEDGDSHLEYQNAISGEYVNLDLSVYRNDNRTWNSILSNSSTEMIYLDLNNSYNNYEIRISDVGEYEGVIRYGYAYSTNNPDIKPVTNEGIYYIRNYYSDKYLTLNTSTNETYLTDFTGNNNQQWVIWGPEDDYEIYPAHYAKLSKINFGSQVGSNPYYRASLGTNDLNFSIRSWEIDSSLEPDAHVFTSSSGGSNNILSYTSATGIFVRSAIAPVVNIHRMWLLENINYRKGDVTLDGNVTGSDVIEIQKYISSIVDFNNAQLYLADANNDYEIDIKDVTFLQSLIQSYN